MDKTIGSPTTASWLDALPTSFGSPVPVIVPPTLNGPIGPPVLQGLPTIVLVSVTVSLYMKLTLQLPPGTPVSDVTAKPVSVALAQPPCASAATDKAVAAPIAELDVPDKAAPSTPVTAQL